MSRVTQSGAAEAPRRVRCAICTHKSTSQGPESDFNTLDAQHEAAEFYVRERGESWEVLPARYDDGGFTGANIVRPALQRQLVDIDAGKVDIVVVYRVDRLSRSLLDFAQFERDMIADSISDKMCAASKRGKWLGSRPPLGFLGDRERMPLVVVPDEADQVRTMFQLYLRLGSAAEVARRINELARERTKTRTRAGREVSGGA